MPISTIGSNSLNQTSDLTINGQTVGKGGGNVATNTAHGVSALAANTSGAQNIAIGYQTLYLNQTGIYNNAVGLQSLYSNVSGNNNNAFGYNALGNTTGSNNVGIGHQALNSNTTASSNTAVGYQAGYTNTTGAGNVFLGNQTGYSNTASNNTFLGNSAGYAVTSGAKNTIIGQYNGNQGGIDIRTSSNNIVLSDGDGNPRLYNLGTWWAVNSLAGTDATGVQVINSSGGTTYFARDNSTGSAFGYGAYQSVIYASNRNIYVQAASGGVVLSNGGTSWASASDSRLKNITGTYTTALADISQIQPVKFTWKNDTENKPQVGVIAQSVQSIVPEAINSGLLIKGDDTEYLSVRYTELIPLMIASIQELKTIVDAQAAEIAELKAKVA